MSRQEEFESIFRNQDEEAVFLALQSFQDCHLSKELTDELLKKSSVLDFAIPLMMRADFELTPERIDLILHRKSKTSLAVLIGRNDFLPTLEQIKLIEQNKYGPYVNSLMQAKKPEWSSKKSALDLREKFQDIQSKKHKPL